MSEGYLLGIDIGTSSSKAVITDERGHIAATASVTHEVSMPHPGHFEHDAEAVWWHDLVLLCREVLAKGGVEAELIRAVGVSAISPAVLPLDNKNRPLRPGILYGIDTRATAECAELSATVRDQFGAPVIFNSQSVAPKLLWLRRNEADVWARTHLILGAEGYLVYRLTGEATIDIYDSSAYSPLADTNGMEWIDKYPDICDASQLPRRVWSTDVVGEVTRDAARMTGLAAGTPVISGTADAAAEATSCGLALEGDLMLMYGTSSFFILRTDGLRPSASFWAVRFLEEGTFAVAGGMATAGGFPAWFREVIGHSSSAVTRAGEYDDLMHMARQSVPGAHGLIALPYLAGERTPFFDPHARGGFLGLTVRHNRGDLYRAVLESIAYGIRHNLEQFEKDGYEVRRILAIGGGTNNPLLLQLVSDIGGVEQLLPAETVGAALGDALRAGVGIGVFADLAEAASVVGYSRALKPDPTDKAVYDRMFHVYKDFYSKTAALMPDLESVDRER